MVHAVVRAPTADVASPAAPTEGSSAPRLAASVAAALTRHGPRRVLGPSRSCYPAGQTLQPLPPLPPVGAAASADLEPAIAEPPPPPHSYSATPHSGEEGEKAPLREHRVLRLFDGDLDVELIPTRAELQ